MKRVIAEILDTLNELDRLGYAQLADQWDARFATLQRQGPGTSRPLSPQEIMIDLKRQVDQMRVDLNLLKQKVNKNNQGIMGGGGGSAPEAPAAEPTAEAPVQPQPEQNAQLDNNLL